MPVRPISAGPGCCQLRPLTLLLVGADDSWVHAVRVLIAMTFAVGSGYAVVRTGRSMTAAGVGLEDGGGWTALLIVEVLCSLAASAVAMTP